MLEFLNKRCYYLVFFIVLLFGNHLLSIIYYFLLIIYLLINYYLLLIIIFNSYYLIFYCFITLGDCRFKMEPKLIISISVLLLLEKYHIYSSQNHARSF